MILETKLTLPQPKAGVLLRTGLIELIKNNLDKKLILITADAGYGKTTLLGQLVKTAKLPCMFYDLDKGDSDLMEFYTYLVNGIKQIEPALVKYSEELLKQGGEIGKNAELLFGTLINELYEKRKEELFIILDNYHNIAEDSAVHSALDFFIDRLPEKIHVIISSRSIPGLTSLSRWQAKQDMFEVMREELAFTGEEIAVLLRDVYKTALSEEDMRQVSAHTEGWITGIRLILQSNGRGEKTIQQSIHEQMDANKPLFDYFVNDILSGESEVMHGFLTKSSILETMTPAACDAILGVKDSDLVLKNLVKRHLFISSTGSIEYKYHHLFRNFLQRQIENQADRRSLCLKAARYFQQARMPVTAIDFMLEAGQYRMAATAIIRSLANPEMDTYFAVVNKRIRSLPGDILASHPRLLVEKGVLCQEQGDLQEAEGLFLRAEEVIKRDAGKSSRGAKHGTAMADALLSRGKLFWLQGRYEEAFPVLRRALNACPNGTAGIKAMTLNLMGLTQLAKGNYRQAIAYVQQAKPPAILAGNNIILIMIESNLAMIHLYQGKVRLAVDVFKSTYEAVKGKYYMEVGVFYANAANAALLAGEAEWAEKLLGEGWNVCNPYEDIRSKAALNSGYGSLYAYNGKWDLARQHLEKAREESARIEWRDVEGKVLQKLAGVSRCQRDWGKAGEYLGLAQPKFQALSLGWVGLQLELAQLEISQGKYGKASATVSKCLQLSRRHGWKIEEFQAQLAAAAIWMGKGDVNKADRIMPALIDASKRNAYDGLLIRALKHNPALADLLRRRRFKTGYVRTLIARSADEAEPAFNADVRIRLFGTLQICLADGREIPIHWPTRKEAVLFAYLLIHRERLCDRHELMERFWPKSSLGQKAKDLRTSISRIQKALADGLNRAGGMRFKKSPWIVHQDKGYRLSLENEIRLDVDDFKRQWQRSRELEREGLLEESQQCRQKAMDMYREGFLVNVDDDWQEEMSAEYEKIFRLCLIKSAVYLSRQSDHDEASRLFQRAIALAPFDEEIRWEYWKALSAAGRIKEIKKDYVLFTKTVQKELGAGLEKETEELFRSLVTIQPQKANSA